MLSALAAPEPPARTVTASGISSSRLTVRRLACGPFIGLVALAAPRLAVREPQVLEGDQARPQAGDALDLIGKTPTGKTAETLSRPVAVG